MPVTATTSPLYRVLFVCLGNICRSPTAEGVFRKAVCQRQLAAHFEIDSAGTGDWHIGAPPYPQAQDAAQRRGIDLSGLRARQIKATDLAVFDYVIAMDRTNYSDLVQLAGAQYAHKVHLFLDLCPDLAQQEVPDPYYADSPVYEQALDLIEQASEALLTYIIKAHAPA